MIAAAALLVLAFLLTVVAPPLLERSAWPSRSPRLGVMAWQAVSTSALVSVVLAGLALAVPVAPGYLTDGVAGFLGACAVALREHYQSPWTATAGIAGVLLSVLVTARAATESVRALGRARRDRRRRRSAVMLVARRDVVPGVYVVDDPRPSVFCIPGRRPTVVMTQGALTRLDVHQRRMVLAHERAHLRGRHALALSMASALHRGFPWVRLFGRSADEIAALVEMHADDRAASRGDERRLAAALVRLADSPSPPRGGLGANGAAAARRVQRLASGRSGIGRVRALGVALGIGMVLAAPPAVALAPALETAVLDYCPVTSHV